MVRKIFIELFPIKLSKSCLLPHPTNWVSLFFSVDTDGFHLIATQICFYFILFIYLANLYICPFHKHDSGGIQQKQLKTNYLLLKKLLIRNKTNTVGEWTNINIMQPSSRLPCSHGIPKFSFSTIHLSPISISNPDLTILSLKNRVPQGIAEPRHKRV